MHTHTYMHKFACKHTCMQACTHMNACIWNEHMQCDAHYFSCHLFVFISQFSNEPTRTHDIPSTVGPEAWVERQSNGASTEVRIFKGILEGLHIACTVTRWRLASQKTQMHPILNTILTKAVLSSSTNKTTHPTHTLSQQYCPAIAHKCIWFRAAIYIFIWHLGCLNQCQKICP